MTEIDPRFIEDTVDYPGGSSPEAARAADVAEWEALRAETGAAELEAADEDYYDDGGYYGDQAAQLSQAGDQLALHHTIAAAVEAEDMADQVFLTTRPSDEDKSANALARIQAGTYRLPSYFAPARGATGRYASACGHPDDFGRCSSRYHSPSCHVVTEEAAAIGNAEEAKAWAGVLRGYTQPPGVSLAAPADPDPGWGADAWASLLESPGQLGGSPDLATRVRHHLGIGEQLPPPERPEYPDTTVLRATLGI